MFKCSFLLLLLTVVVFADGDTDPGSSFSAPHYSVMVGDIPLTAALTLEKQGFLVEWAHYNKAMIYVDAEREELLRHLGYSPSRVDYGESDATYPTVTEIHTSMDSVLAAYPSITRGEALGTSVEGRPLRAVVVTANPGIEEVEPELRIHGGIHGDEKTSVMVTLTYLKTLTESYATSPMSQYLIDNTEIWIIPLVNPDGYADGVYGDRLNAHNIDLNRNCSYMGPGGGGGSVAFSEPETAAIRDITMQNWPAIENFINPFSVGLSLHGGAACFNAPWNYTETPLPEDVDLMYVQGADYAANPSIVAYFGSGAFDVWVPGASWYPTNGDVNDWSYGECGTVDHTIEVHGNKRAPDWPAISNAHYMAIMEIFTNGTYGIWGTVEDAVGNPLDALIEIGISDGHDSAGLRFCRTDVTLGDYHKTLLPGTYDVMASVPGYSSQILPGIVLGAEERVEVSFVMDMVGIEEGQGGVESYTGDLTIHPNPVSYSCEISLPSTGVGGTLAIYDITGRQVFRREVLSGALSLVWDCRRTTGDLVPSGVYVTRFTSGRIELTERLVVNR